MVLQEKRWKQQLQERNQSKKENKAISSFIMEGGGGGGGASSTEKAAVQFPDCLVGETSEALTEGRREIQVIRRVQKSTLKKNGDGYTIQTIYEAVIDGIALRRRN